LTALEIDTPHGPARVHVRGVEGPRAALVLGHGAGGGIAAPDLAAVARVANDLRIAVALVEQPYRVAGRRSPPRAPQLDEAWLTVIDGLRAAGLAGPPLVAGGRSSGARVACRTAAAAGAVAVLCLAFPLQPPARRNGVMPPDRRDELDRVLVPVLVIQGERDPFGMPSARRGRTVVRVAGDHSLKTALPEVAAAARRWLGRVVV
jgi:predicted alpha/beta-hydrolase family hydrolase